MDGLDIRDFPLIFDVIEQGIFTVDSDTRITAFNQAAARISGFRAEETIGRLCSDVFRTDLCGEQCPLRQSFGALRPVSRDQVHIHTRSGKSLSTCVFAAPLVSRSGELVGGIEVFHDLHESGAPCDDLPADAPAAFSGIVSRNAEMKRIFQLLPLVADSDAIVLVTGDSGTGKELIARAVHARSRRADGPFVAVNCAAMPEGLLESELFGYRKGAFTDARRDKPGRIAEAEHGTLFLDEVGDLSLALQVKLLRFLQDRCYEPLGSNRTREADVRILAATNRDLEAAVREGRFRVDLFYRLNVFPIELPPLSRRPEDIPLLVAHFVRAFRRRTGRPIELVSPDALAALLRYPWPGNVRELENAVEHGFILCRGIEIGVEHLPAHIGRAAPAPAGAPGPVACARGRLDEVERAAVIDALQRHAGNRTHAARELGIHRTTLVRKLKRLGIRG